MAKMISHGSLGMRTIIFVWLAIFVVSSYTIIEGRHISREDYLEAKRLVKLSRRPSVKVIQVEDGDIIDCVIINKQLAFEHPALKNHTIRMKPTFVPEWQKDEGSNYTSLSIGLKGGGCPVGSIPVQRLQVSDILRSTSVSSFGRKDTRSGHHYAVVHYHGEFSEVKALVNVWNPNVGDNQFSLLQIWITNNSPFELTETIEAGWMVNPQKFGDHQTRFFTYWTRDNYKKTGCFNSECAGFMQLSQKYIAGRYVFETTSSYDGPQTSVYFVIQKDEAGDWLLYINSELIGYWPYSIFRRLSFGGSTRVDWGGEVSDLISPNPQSWPQMGSGHFPDRDNIHGKSCFVSIMRVSRGGERWEDIGDFAFSETKPNCYRVIDGGIKPVWIRNIAFGGPGGQC